MTCIGIQYLAEYLKKGFPVLNRIELSGSLLIVFLTPRQSPGRQRGEDLLLLAALVAIGRVSCDPNHQSGEQRNHEL